MVREPKSDELKEREKTILRHVVHNFIQTAVPVGSRYISKHFESNLSSATIRNVMADLEDFGFLSHPHTSAGRIPTDMGYRYYVDYLMEVEELTSKEKSHIEHQIETPIDPADLLKEASKLLGKISKQLSIVSSPHIGVGVLDKLELVSLSNTKLLVVMSIRSGIVRTLMLEVRTEISRDSLEQINRILNERLVGLSLQQIRDSFAERVRDLQGEQTGLIRLFIESVDQLFDDTKEREKVYISGTNNIVAQPEFGDPKNFRSVIELIENEDIIVHLLEKHDELEKDFVITIGAENDESKAKEYSMLTATYDIDGATGRVGIFGPKRMKYSKVIPLVDHVAKSIARMLAS